MTAILIPLMSSLGPWAVLLLMLVCFAETGILAGFFLPGDSVLFAAGVMGAAGVINVPFWLMVVAVVLAAAAGDQLGYAIGRRFGARVFERPGARLLSPRHLEHARAFFARHGPRSVVLARFVPLARTATPVLAGVSRMPRRRFSTYNVGGALLWASCMLGAGHLFGGVPIVAGHIELITVGLVLVSLLPAAVALLRARVRRSLARSAAEAEPGLGEARELERV